MGTLEDLDRLCLKEKPINPEKVFEEICIATERNDYFVRGCISGKFRGMKGNFGVNKEYLFKKFSRNKQLQYVLSRLIRDGRVIRVKMENDYYYLALQKMSKEFAELVKKGLDAQTPVGDLDLISRRNISRYLLEIK